LKVLLVHNRYRSASPSGEDRVVDQEGEALEVAGHTVERFERFSDDIASGPVAQRALVPFRVVWSDQSRRSLQATLRRLRPDVVHVHNTFPLLSPSVLYACRSEGVPVVATLHNYALVCANGALFRDGAVCHDCIGRLPLPAVRHGCYRDSPLATVPVATGMVAHRQAWRNMVSAYIFISDSQRALLADGLPQSRLFVKPNFVGATPTPIVGRDEIVVYAGRLAPAKGIPLLMEAWDRYASGGGRRLRLVIAGAGPLGADVAAWASTRPSVELVGMLDRTACSLLMGRSRAVVIPSVWQETFGLVAIEAMAMAVPSVATRRGSFPELITDGRDGVLFDPDDVAALPAIFEDIETNPTRYEALGQTAYETYGARFSVEGNMSALEAIYQFATDNLAR